MGWNRPRVLSRLIFLFVACYRDIEMSFWGLGIGLALMVITNLFPEGILQVWDVLENGCWHARSLEFVGTDRFRMREWASMPSHLIRPLPGGYPYTPSCWWSLI